MADGAQHMAARLLLCYTHADGSIRDDKTAYAMRTPSKTGSRHLRWRRAIATGLSVLGCAVTAAGADDLAKVLDDSGSTVTVNLNSGTVYTIGQYKVSGNKTLMCNGATIQSTDPNPANRGPIHVIGPGLTLTVDNCNISGDGWALLGALDGAALVVRNNTHMTGSNNSAIYLRSATLTLTGGSIDQARWGVQMENSTASVHGVSITGTTFGVQNVAGKLTLDSSTLTNLDPGAGPGVSIIGSAQYPSSGASATISNTTFTGFLNAIDIQPTAAQGLPSGTVTVTASTFITPLSSALSASDASNVRFATSSVSGAHTDGIYLANSTGVIEDSQIVNSLNSGVTFWGCRQGATIRNSLVSGSAHQGVAVVADAANNRISHNVQVVDNTLKNNAIANLLVDNLSDAVVQGNIMTGAPVFSVRVQGSPGVSLVADLVYKSYSGIEVKDSANASIVLSAVSAHDHGGVLAYTSSIATFSHSAFQSNGLSPGDYSIYVNSSAQVAVQRATFELAGQLALLNTGGNTAVATNNYWSSPGGPSVNLGGGGGARLDWNIANGSLATYQPYMTTSPLDARISNTFNLSAGTMTQWSPDNGAFTLALTGAPGTTVSGGIVGELRLNDSSTLTARVPPAGTFSDGVFVVWAEYDLLAHAQSGSLRFKTVGSGATAVLSRLEPDHCWLPVVSSWDSAASQIVYSPADVTTINGVFAIGAPQPDRQTVARALITSYYTDILARAPEAGAVDSWYNAYFLYAVNASVDVRFVPREMARVFFAGAEYAARARTREQFIHDAYQVFLRRAPSQSEVDSWLGWSWNQAQAVTIFAESPEFDVYVQGIFPCLAGDRTGNFVTTMYIGLLDRLVDAGGLAYWKAVFGSAFLSRGIAGARDQARSFGVQVLASSEYTSKNPTNDTHVVRLYRAYLGRYPGTSEIAYWRGQLDSHALTTTNLIDQFAASPEFTARLNTFFGPAF